MHNALLIAFTGFGAADEITLDKLAGVAIDQEDQNLVLMESTDLLDKNGMEMFEGDEVGRSDYKLLRFRFSQATKARFSGGVEITCRKCDLRLCKNPPAPTERK